MVIYSLLAKDMREHRAAAVLLGAGCLVVVLLLLAQNSVAAYSMSAFEIVRFSLITFLPLIALIVGNRLVVNEYLSGTRLFVEALPVGNVLPLILKYLLGFGYISLLATVMVLLAGQKAGIADDVTPEYLALILAKTWVMVSLYWSVVFCFSLCGYLRIALYLVTAAVVAVLAYYPGLDASRFAPMALIDNQLFVYERDIIPWKDMGLTLSLSLAFTLAGFLLTRLGEGSVIERLAKPMTRRDYVALGVLAASGLALASTLMEENHRDPISFSNANVIRLTDPEVSVLYIDEQYEDSASTLAERISSSLSTLQATLALPALPTVRLVLSPSREKHDIDYATRDGVFITANWLEHESYDDAVFDSVVMHGVLSAQTNNRSVFEPYHWVLDGFTRWWVEQGTNALNPQHRNELVARALLTLERDNGAVQLIERWQLIADRFSYPSAEALAWAAMTYLEETADRDSVVMLANEFLTHPAGSTVMASLKDQPQSVGSRIESIVGMPIKEFHAGWQQWLEEQRNNAGVQRFLQSVPAVDARVITQTDSSGVRSLQAAYELAPDKVSGQRDNLDSLEGSCIMKHDYIGPFDTEFDVPDDYEDITSCQIDTVAHSVNSVYTSGDRVFVALDYEKSLFHQPVRLHAQRVYIP
ncbi:MAG: hypothetical protein AB8B87_07860 [Granulosicoccus sp.]